MDYRRSLMMGGPMDGYYFHSKSGNYYYLMTQANLESDETGMAVYTRVVHDPNWDVWFTGPVWVRPLSEFMEKFKPVSYEKVDHALREAHRAANP